VRAVITSPEAATIIGKGGENVSRIRSISGAKCTVSDYQKGAVERILTVSGVVDAVAKAFGLIIRTLNNEPLEEPSNAHSKTYPLRLLVPHVLIGSIIGKGGARIKEIQEASGARLNASDTCLPLSSERSLVVMGVADAVHIATYYVGSTLLEQLNDRFGGPAASAYATRSGGPAGAVPEACRLFLIPLSLLEGTTGAVTTTTAVAPILDPTICRPTSSTLLSMAILINPMRARLLLFLTAATLLLLEATAVRVLTCPLSSTAVTLGLSLTPVPMGSQLPAPPCRVRL